MFDRYAYLILAMMLLSAGLAHGEEPTTGTGSTGTEITGTESNEGAYDALSVGGKAHADALYEAQFDAEQPPEGKDWLTRDDFASGEGGWGVKFKEWQEQGYFPDAKNFGEVVSRYRKEQNFIKHGGGTASDGGSADTGTEVVITSGSGRQAVYEKRNGKLRAKADGGSAVRPASGRNAHGVKAGGGAGKGIVTGRGVSVGGGAAASAAVAHGNGGGLGGGGHGAGHGGGKK